MLQGVPEDLATHLSALRKLRSPAVSMDTRMLPEVLVTILHRASWAGTPPKELQLLEPILTAVEHLPPRPRQLKVRASHALHHSRLVQDLSLQGPPGA